MIHKSSELKYGNRNPEQQKKLQWISCWSCQMISATLYSATLKNPCFEISLSRKGPFTNTCQGGLMQNNFRAKNFQGPPFGPQNFSGPPFLARKIGVNPTENHIDSFFRGKISVFFFQGPPFQTSKIFRAPLFVSGPLPLQVFVNGP